MPASATRQSDPRFAFEPAQSARVDRRQSRRRRLRKPTEVILHGTGPAGSWQRSGTLLNLSPDGIACRLRGEDAERLVCGQNLRVVFRLEGARPPFDLRGQVSNLTEGGTADHVVVGVAFVAGDHQNDVRDRLRHTLGAACGPHATPLIRLRGIEGRRLTPFAATPRNVKGEDDQERSGE